MRKNIILFLPIILCLFVGCGKDKEKKPKYMSEEFYNAGVAFVDICDDFLDSKIDINTVMEKIEYQSAMLDAAVKDMEKEKDDNESTDEFCMRQECYQATAKVSILYIKTLRADSDYKIYSSLPDDYLSELKNTRNEIAELLNLKKR